MATITTNTKTISVVSSIRTTRPASTAPQTKRFSFWMALLQTLASPSA